MNLHSNLQYPFFKYLIEELSGRFYQNELTCMNRMLILYHNRYLFSADDDTSTYLGEWQQHMENPVKFWYLSASKRQGIALIRTRILYLLRHNRSVFQQLLSRQDYSSVGAKQQVIFKIYQWLQTLPEDAILVADIDINQWKRELLTKYGALFNKYFQPEIINVSSKQVKIPFHQILTGRNEIEKIEKFQRLVGILLKERWISPAENNDVYKFRNTGHGSRLQIAALYYVLNKQGHIADQLNAPQIAAVFNSFLSHHISPKSFVKAFQAEQQDSFNCRSREPRYRYVQQASLLIQQL